MQPMAVAAWSLLTPFGEGDATLDALFEQRTAFSSSPSRWKFRNRLAAVVPDRCGRPLRERQRQRHFAMHVASSTLAALPPGAGLEPDRCAFVFATSFGHLLDDPDSDTMSTWAKDCVLALGYDQEPIVVGSGCSSGADALGVAAALLDSGAIDSAVVVAADIVTEAKQIAHSSLGTMTASKHRPFDVNRSGMLLGEGAGAVVLKRSEEFPNHAGELVGVGAANDAFGLTAPDPTGLSIRLALERALCAAQLSCDELALYLAHGTGTLLNDELEARMVEEIFVSNRALTVVGTKGALGHSLGACGMVEFILLLRILDRGLAPPTIGLSQPLAGLASRFAEPNGRQLNGRLGVSMKLGFGGFNTALIARA